MAHNSKPNPDLTHSRILEPLIRFAQRHQTRSILHVDAHTGLLGAALRWALDYAHGRLTPNTWQTQIIGLAKSGSTVPFGPHYNHIHAAPLHTWLKNNPDTFDLILAPRIALDRPCKQAEKNLRSLYRRANSLLVTLVHNNLAAPHKHPPPSGLTLQHLSALFPRLHYVDLDHLALAVIKNEFLPL